MEVIAYDIEQIRENFQQLFGTEPLLVRSPGRINIIGEHTDYNEGFVLPAAIDKAAYVAVAKSGDTNINLYSRSFKESYKCSLTTLFPRKTWTDYVLGVVDQLLINGYNITGFNLVLDGDIIIGAGLSSSAAVECSVIYALNALFELGLSKIEMVKLI